MAKRYNLDDYKQKKRADAIEIEAGDGSVFTIDPPALWHDDLLQKAAGGGTPDPIESGRLLLGDRYDAFVAAGGSAALLNSIVAEEYGVSVPE